MTKKSQELKNKILKNLTDWCFDPLGDLVDATALMNRVYKNENSYYFRYYNDETESETTPAELTLGDYQEVKEAMINEIKQGARDWKIGKEGDLTVVKHKSGRKHWKGKGDESRQEGFRENEWKEIENALKGQQQKISPNPGREQKDDYRNWTHEQLITEINRLKAENEELKNNQTLTSSERQERIQQNQRKLERLEFKIINNSGSNADDKGSNNLGTIFLVSGILVLVGLGIYRVIVKKSKKVKK